MAGHGPLTEPFWHCERRVGFVKAERRVDVSGSDRISDQPAVSSGVFACGIRTSSIVMVRPYRYPPAGFNPRRDLHERRHPAGDADHARRGRGRGATRSRACPGHRTQWSGSRPSARTSGRLPGEGGRDVTWIRTRLPGAGDLPVRRAPRCRDRLSCSAGYALHGPPPWLPLAVATAHDGAGDVEAVTASRRRPSRSVAPRVRLFGACSAPPSG